MKRLNSSGTPRFRTRTVGLALGAAVAAALLVGCAGQAPLASSSAAVSGQGDLAVSRAEQRVARSPRDARNRAVLAQAYLAAGRFDSAATTFEDAIALGDQDPRTGLGAALAYAGAGRNAEALAVLERVRDRLAGSDYGLAVALAGQPAMGVSILTDVVRGGDATPKARQNLAYAYALDGRWREARLIASQDLTGDQLDARLNEWAASASPDKGRERIAGLIGAPLRGDAGQPAMLALNQPADAPQLAIADTPAAVAAPVSAAAGELPAVQGGESFWGADQPEAAEPEPAPSPASAKAPAATPRMVAAAEQSAPAQHFASKPLVQPVPARSAPTTATPAAAPRARMAAAQRDAAQRDAGPATHLVQLGSFRTMDGARRAWAIFQARNPRLKDHALRITEAQVNGQRYYRVAAEGFDRDGAQSLCATVRQTGAACLAYAEHRPLPGAMLASR